GFDETTVAEIAERAGVTERTFFRHFSDKREVLFRGNELAERVGHSRELDQFSFSQRWMGVDDALACSRMRSPAVEELGGRFERG
ncbi:helix-turn-helix domain-containing protein, partial [Mycolicibacterium moriokaense]|uniref:helix-turn-helix domain-containing protein n=1 Tax=Mycolicibacterium moriokaense TaxID=39691 RepID=UPI001055EE37